MCSHSFLFYFGAQIVRGKKASTVLCGGARKTLLRKAQSLTQYNKKCRIYFTLPLSVGAYSCQRLFFLFSFCALLCERKVSRRSLTRVEVWKRQRMKQLQEGMRERQITLFPSGKKTIIFQRFSTLKVVYRGIFLSLCDEICF